MRKQLILLVGAAGAAVWANSCLPDWLPRNSSPVPLAARLDPPLPSRSEQIKRLSTDSFDVLVIGGGATGSGVALDAAARGLKTVLIERDDFCSGTSSRSTKLLHGGIRYLEQAVFNLDWEQLHLVYEALHERTNIIRLAPHLTKPLPILMPLYKWWELPYLYAGAKCYDFLAGSMSLGPSRLLNRKKTEEEFPLLKLDGLTGSVIYYDGQMNDARLGVSVALTAAAKGAVVLNHVSAVALLKNSAGQISGAVVRNNETGEEMQVRSKVVVNATGPFVDQILSLDDPTHKPTVTPSSGVHLILPSYFTPPSTGLLIPRTRDGRVLFLLPWEGHTLAGTTDHPSTVSDLPAPADADADFILDELRKYLGVPIAKSDVQAAWFVITADDRSPEVLAGIRPLAKDPTAKSTAAISRDHIIWQNPSGLVNVAGGKWTTYRRMAEDVMDVVTRTHFPGAPTSRTESLPLVGGREWRNTDYVTLAQQFNLSPDTAKHLSHNYGTRAYEVAALAQEKKLGAPLAATMPFIEAEVIYAVRREMAMTVNDVIGRRTRMAFLDQKATVAVLPRVIALLAEELSWNTERQEKERKEAKAFLKTMNLPAKQG